MDLLVDSVDGARDILDIYNSGSWLIKLGGRNFYKTNTGDAIIVFMDFGYAKGITLISKNKETVVFSTDCTDPVCSSECPLNDAGDRTVCSPTDDYYVVHKGVRYYYSPPLLWVGQSSTVSNKVNFPTINVNMDGADGNVEEILSRYNAAVLGVVRDKVKYYDIATAT